MSMLTTEWNWDTAKEVWQEEAREEGIGVGLAQGREETRKEERQYFLELLNQGLSVEEIKERLKN